MIGNHAHLILFSDYLSSKSSKNHILASLEYIGTREGVELNQRTENNHIFQILNEQTKNYDATKKQKELIKNLLKDYPDMEELPEYDEYIKQEDMYHASVFIREAYSLAMEMMMGNQRYMKYISERPGVIKNHSGHGLFDACGVADIQEYMEELESYEGNVYRDIISLTRKDAALLDYDKQEMWKSLLQTKMLEKARILGVPETDLRWVAAFHDEGHHPHVHVMSWAINDAAIYQTAEHIREFKSTLVNEVYKDWIWLNKELKQEYRNELEDKIDTEIQMITKSAIKEMSVDTLSGLEEQLIHLSKQLSDGRPYYMYQSQETKELVDKIVANIYGQKGVKGCFENYLAAQTELASFYMKKDSQNLNSYTEELMKKMISPNKNDRKVIHNMVISAAMEIKNAARNKMISCEANIKQYQNRLTYPIVLENIADSELKTLVHGLVKMERLLDHDTEEIIDTLFKIEGADQEKILEYGLDVPASSGIKTKEINTINKYLKVQIQDASNMNELKEEYERRTAHAASHLLSNIISFFADGKIRVERDIKEALARRHEDQYLIRQAKQK